MTDSEILEAVRATIKEWDSKQSHDRCWYYPDLYRQLAALTGVELTKTPVLPPRAEFEAGCKKYQQEEFDK